MKEKKNVNNLTPFHGEIILGTSVKEKVCFYHAAGVLDKQMDGTISTPMIITLSFVYSLHQYICNSYE